MLKSCGCLIGMIFGFIVALAIAFFIACAAFDKKPSEIREYCQPYWDKLTKGGTQVVEKAEEVIDAVPKEIKK